MSNNSTNLGQTVLEGTTNFSATGWTPNKPKIIEFYGHEGEDFRHFKTVLETFFSLTGLTQDQRRVAILRTQLRRAAATFFDNSLKKKGLTITHVTYKDAMKLLEEQYITSRLIQNYELAFNEMTQATGESPREFLSRLYEAADLAEIEEEKFIHSRFRAGLSLEIKTFCREQSASSFEEWVKHATGWWNAHSKQSIRLVDNPFIPSTQNYLTADNSREALLIKNNRNLSLKNLDSDDNAFDKNLSNVNNFESPTIAKLTAKLEALDLKQLITSEDSRKHTSNNSLLKDDVTNLFESNKSIRSLVKNIVQELMVEDYAKDKSDSYNRYGKKPYNNYRSFNRRRPYYQDEMYYDNDHYNPGEGYYRPNRNNYREQKEQHNNGYADNTQGNNHDNSYNIDNQGHTYQNRNNYTNGYSNNNYQGRNNHDNRYVSQGQKDYANNQHQNRNDTPNKNNHYSNDYQPRGNYGNRNQYYQHHSKN